MSNMGDEKDREIERLRAERDGWERSACEQQARAQAAEQREAESLASLEKVRDLAFAELRPMPDIVWAIKEVLRAITSNPEALRERERDAVEAFRKLAAREVCPEQPLCADPLCPGTAIVTIPNPYAKPTTDEEQS